MTGTTFTQTRKHAHAACARGAQKLFQDLQTTSGSTQLMMWLENGNRSRKTSVLSTSSEVLRRLATSATPKLSCCGPLTRLLKPVSCQLFEVRRIGLLFAKPRALDFLN